MPENLPPAICIMGPTAAGKTELALAIADRLPCGLISVDSALVYRGLDIGTAKPSPTLLARYPHRLIDICEPNEAYSAARFRADALAAMAEVTAVGRIPLLVGGTMLYFRALQRGLSVLPAADPAVRQQLAERHVRDGNAGLHRWLAVVDPAAAARIHPNDPQRVQRALEVYLLTGRAMSEQWGAVGDALPVGPRPGSVAAPLPYRLVKLVRSPRERAVLHRRIGARFDAMLAAGFEDEVRRLRARGDLTAALPSMRAVGYRQLWAYLDGVLSFAAMRERAIIATRQLAKRQYTWLRAEPDCCWLWDDDDLPTAALALLASAGIG